MVNPHDVTTQTSVIFFRFTPSFALEESKFVFTDTQAKEISNPPTENSYKAHIQPRFLRTTIQLIHTYTLQSMKDFMKFGVSLNMLAT